MLDNEQRLNLMLVEAERKSVRSMWQVRRHQPPVERIAKVALGVALQNKTVRDAVKCHKMRTPDLPGYRYVGSGMEQRVYRNGSNVLKLLYSTDKFGSMKPDDIAEKLQRETDVCKEVLGPVWLSTEFDVLELPSTGLPTVVSRQQFVPHRKAYPSMQDLAADQSVTAIAKDCFADNLQHLHATTGLQADLLGVNNVLLGTQGLTIIDTIPVDASVQQQIGVSGRTVAEDIQSQLDTIRSS